MTISILLALIEFGVLLAIVTIGLIRSNAATEHLHASTHRVQDNEMRRTSPTARDVESY